MNRRRFVFGCAIAPVFAAMTWPKWLKVAPPAFSRQDRIAAALNRYSEEVFRYGPAEKTVMDAPVLLEAIAALFPKRNHEVADHIFGVTCKRYICATGTFLIPEDPQRLQYSATSTNDHRIHAGSPWFHESTVPEATAKLKAALA